MNSTHVYCVAKIQASTVGEMTEQAEITLKQKQMDIPSSIH